LNSSMFLYIFSICHLSEALTSDLSFNLSIFSP
jgi:hypothetical protein